MSDLESKSMVTILEALMAFGLIAGIMLALADTHAGYPLVVGILIVAVTAFSLKHSAQVGGLGNFVANAGAIASGNKAPKGA